jgi:hypothetical protein
MRKYVGKQEIRGTLKELGVPPELLLPEEARAIEQLLSDADPSEMEAVTRGIQGVFANARNRAGSVLHIDPGEPSVHWTDAEMANYAGHLASDMAEGAIKAGIDPATAKTQAVEFATGLLESEKQGFARVLQDFEPVATNPKAVGVIMDHFIDYTHKKGDARLAVDALSNEARAIDTPEAWTKKRTGTDTIYNKLRGDLEGMVQETRTILQRIFNGEDYTPRYNWWETTKGYLNWDKQEFAALRANPPLGRTPEAEAAFQHYLDMNRQLRDNSQYELMGAFQTYPTMEAFDIVKEGLRRTEAMGAEASWRSKELLKRRAAGELSADEYDRQNMALWNKHFDDAAALNQMLGKIIVRKGLEKQVVSELKWTDSDGQEWQLLQPSKVQGKWQARNTQNNKVEEFTVAQSADEIGPSVVPKNVVDDLARLGGDAELDKAADAVMQEIAASAPEPAAPPRSTPSSRFTRGEMRLGVSRGTNPPWMDTPEGRRYNIQPEIMSEAEAEYWQDSKGLEDYYDEFGPEGAFGYRYSEAYQRDELRAQAVWRLRASIRLVPIRKGL